MEERLISFALFGQDFSFYSDAPEEEVQQAVAMLRDELEQTGFAAKGSTVPSSAMLVLAGLRLAGRCVSIENEFGAFQVERKLHRERKKLVEEMLVKISEALEG